MGNQLKYSFLFLLITIVIGTGGYRYLVDVSWIDGFYMTMITLSTVGYGEVVDFQHHPEARLFTIFLILVGMGNLIFFVSLTTSYFTEGKIHQYFKVRNNMQKIKQFKKHYILCGVGRIGRHVLQELVDHGKQVVVIEKDPAAFQWLEENYLKKRKKHVFCLRGDAQEDEVLLEAGLNNAEAFFCCLTNDQDNLLLTVTVKNINSSCKVHTRLRDIANEKKFFNVGADYVVSPQYIGGITLADQALYPTTAAFMQEIFKRKSHAIEEVTVPQGSWVIGKSLKEVDFQENLAIYPIAVKEGKKISYSPSPNRSLIEHEVLIFILTLKKKREVEEWLRKSR